MKRSRLILLSTFILISFSSIAQKISEALLSELELAEKAMFEATANGDSSAFRKLAGPDYYTINANGSSQTLEEALPFVPRFKGATAKLSEQQQRVFGDVALRTGRAKFYFGDQQVGEALYTSGWVYRDKRWQFIHWQGTLTGMSLEGKGALEPPKN